VYKWDFIEKLLPYCKITPGSDPVFAAVKDGECPIGWVNEGAPVALIYPKDVVTIQMDAFGLVNNGPNPAAVKSLMEFLGTKEAHTIAATIIKRRSAPEGYELTSSPD
jgi:iron(III) transport system substrate-binding protein